MRREDDANSFDEAEELDPDDPNNPENPDYDLSESAPLYLAPEPKKPWFLQRWLLILVAFFAIGGIMLPYLRDIF